MAKFGNNKQDNRKDTSAQGYFLYPDGVVRWGVNVRICGQCGVEVAKDAEVDVTEHFKQEQIDAFLARKAEIATL